MENKKSRDLSI